MLNSASWTEFPITDTGLRWKKETAPVGPGQHVLRPDIVVGHGDRVDAFLMGYLLSFCQVQWKEVDSCSDMISGKTESLTKTGDTLNSEASFSYLGLSQTAIPTPSPSTITCLVTVQTKVCMVFVT